LIYSVRAQLGRRQRVIVAATKTLSFSSFRVLVLFTQISVLEGE
jgi:hypothetical protein